jgi:beta-mannosidase
VDIHVSLQGKTLVDTSSTESTCELEIPDPQLWWPAGQGTQPLYDVTVSGRLPEGSPCGSLHRRIGLRTIQLDRHPDEWGESFQFVVNGRAIFAKGANWIPAHSFVTTLKRADYGRDLQAAVAANMNCVRLWGGGIYESEHFYDWCDELGLMVWHDFMFSCALYPSDDDFVRSVEAEASHQVRRLHHRACLALWCGNNELAQLNADALRESPQLMAGYEKVFHELLPQVVSLHDGQTSYWPSSEWRGTYETGHVHGERSGDSHFWDVWHARHPVKDYERWAFRFCSEFGMQSYSSPATNATFTSPDDRNVFGPAMENHQKNRAGNQVILDYVSRRYRFPKSQDHLIYLSQLNQAYCMQVGVEHYRRLMPRCMGSIYWQLNDCWPVASWSSIEFTGRWKALHYAARRFYAPALVSAHVPGDETTQIGNIRKSTVHEVFVTTVYDAPTAVNALLEWQLLSFDGMQELRGTKRIKLKPGQSVRQRRLDLGRQLANGRRDRVYLKLKLSIAGKVVSSQAVLFAPPRFIALPRAKTRVSIAMKGTTGATITFRSNVYQHAFAFQLGDLVFTASDNFFDLHPSEPVAVDLTFSEAVSKATIAVSLTYHSLVDTYE